MESVSRQNFDAGKRPAITIRGLKKHFGGSPLYDGLDLDIPKDDRVIKLLTLPIFFLGEIGFKQFLGHRIALVIKILLQLRVHFH